MTAVVASLSSLTMDYQLRLSSILSTSSVCFIVWKHPPCISKTSQPEEALVPSIMHNYKMSRLSYISSSYS
jgi:hypothetical protein